MAQRTCSISYCEQVHWAKGMCSLHYQRWRRRGRTDRVCPCGKPARSRTSQPVCNDCVDENRRRSERNARLQADYGIRIGDYERMLAEQGGRCQICRSDNPGRGHPSFSVDHDHVTGQVRGLLCHSCNVGIGHLGDDPARLRAAAAYIEAHRQLRMAV